MPAKLKIRRPPPFKTRRKIKNLITRAFSTRVNPANLEVFWYPPYEKTVDTVVDLDLLDGSISAVQEHNMSLSGKAMKALKLSRDDGDHDGFSDDEGPDPSTPHVDDEADESDVTDPDAPRRSRRIKNKTKRGSAAARKPPAAPAGPAPVPAQNQEGSQPGSSDGSHPSATENDDMRSGSGDGPEASGSRTSEPQGVVSDASSRGHVPVTSGDADPQPDDRGGPQQSDNADLLPSGVEGAPGQPTSSDDPQPEGRDGQQEEGLDAVDEREVSLAADEPELPPAQISARSQATVRDGQRNDNFPDIMACHLGVVDMDEPQDTNSDAHASWEKRMGGHVYHECFPIIQEVKPNPSRSFRGTEYDEARTLLLGMADRDLFSYITLYFIIDSHAESVVAVSAAGPWWRWAKFTKNEFPTTAEWIGRDVDHDYVEGSQKVVGRMERAFVTKFRKRNLFYLGSESSDKEWTKLRDNALIPILQAHPTLYPPAPKLSKGNDRPAEGESSEPEGEKEARPKGKGKEKADKPEGQKEKGTTGKGRKKMVRMDDPEPEGAEVESPKGKGARKATGRGKKQEMVARENEAGPSQPTRKSARRQKQK